MKHTCLVLCSVLLPALASNAHADAPSPVNEVRTFKMNILANASPADVTLKVSGASIQAPLKWSVTVTNASGAVVYSVEHDDKEIDSFFGDEGFIDGCKGHDACKRKWYFEDLPKTIGESANFVKPGHELGMENWRVETLHNLADEFLKKKGLDEAKRAAIIKEMENMMAHGGYGEITLVDSPVSQGPLYMFVPSLGYFVPFYED